MTVTVTTLEAQSLFEKTFGSQAGQATQFPQDQVDRFEQMMANAKPMPHVESGSGQTIVGKAIMDEDAALHTVPNDMLFMMQQGAGPLDGSIQSLQRFATESMYVASEMAQMNANMSVHMALTKSTRHSVETLMKNQ